MICARASLSVAFAALLTFDAVASANQEMLARAKDLYANAAYEEALAVLDGILSDPAPTTRLESSEYRLLCLIALGRNTEARAAIQALVESDPLYQLSAGRASPRVLGMFNEVRQDLLPTLVQRAYGDAKEAFERRDPSATRRFDHVLDILSDPGAASRPALADLRIVVTGFRDLSRAFEASPPPSTDSEAPASPAGATVQPATASSQAIYREGDPGIVAAVPVDQKLPRFVFASLRPPEGVLELLVDENGNVVEATVSTSVHPRYDPLLVTAAKSWKYIAARKDGKPVAVRKVVNVRVVRQ